MSVIDVETFKHPLATRPVRLPDSAYGGLEAAREHHPLGGNHEDFMRELYGDSYEQREICELIHNIAVEIRSARKEIVVDGVPHVQPVVACDAEKNLFIDEQATRRVYEKPVPWLGTTVLFYKDWICLGLRPRFEPVEIEQVDTLRNQVMLAVLPDEPTFEEIVDGRVAIVPNPILYVPTPEDIRAISTALGGRLEYIARTGSYGY